MQTSLTPPRWQWRLPFFAEVDRGGNAVIRGDTDEVMAREIGYAKTAKLDYWAFCAYEEQSPMTLALKRYLKSQTADKPRFCMIGDVSHWPPENMGPEAARFADLMTRPEYQTVLDGRPLFYLLNLALESNAKVWADAGGFRKAVEALHAAARAHGLREPYCVAMVPWPDKARSFADESGCDAISAYAVQAGGQGAPFGQLASYVEDHWKQSAATGAKIVPLAMTGWDRRPRVENPVFWEHNEGWNADIGRYYDMPKPDEMANHVKNAVEWTRGHAASAEARTVIVYAWNEHDEGGWICPNLGEGDARAQALGRALTRP